MGRQGSPYHVPFKDKLWGFPGGAVRLRDSEASEQPHLKDEGCQVLPEKAARKTTRPVPGLADRVILKEG